MKGLWLLFVWVFIVACFTIFGFVDKLGGIDSLAVQEEVAVFAAVGIAAASYVVYGLIVVLKVRSGRMERGMAVVVLVAFAIPGIFLPMLILEVVKRTGGLTHLFGVEHEEYIVFSPVYSFWITLTALLMLTIAAVSVRKKGNANSTLIER